MSASSEYGTFRQSIANSAERLIILLLFLSGPVIALAPKGLAALILLLGLSAAMNLWSRGEKIHISLKGTSLYLLALFVWAGMSVFWAQDMAGAGKKLTQLSGFLLCLPPLWSFAHNTEIFKSRSVQLGMLISFSLAWVLSAFIIFYPAEFVALISDVNKSLTARDMSPVQMQNFVTVSNRAITVLVPLTFVLFACLPRHKWMIAPVLVMVFSIVINSNNQSALIGLSLPVLFMALRAGLPKLIKPIFAIAILLSSVLIVPMSIVNYTQNLAADYLPKTFVQRASVSARTDLYYAYAMAWLKKPITGYGLDSSSSVNFGDTEYNLWSEKTSVHHPHNYFLQLLYELGLPGLLAVLMIVLRLGRSLEGVPVLLSVFGISFFAYNLWQSWLLGMFCLLFFVFSGLISGSSKRRQVSKT